MTGKTDLRNFTFRQLEEYAAGLGHPPFRAGQIFFRMKNVSRDLRTLLDEQALVSRIGKWCRGKWCRALIISLFPMGRGRIRRIFLPFLMKFLEPQFRR